MSKPEGIVEAVGASVASKGLWAGGAAGLVGWLSQVNWIGVSGVAIAALGFLVNTWFRWRQEQRDIAIRQAQELREAAESAARIAYYRERCEIERP
ncbi:holin [Pseudomonas sp. Marseille-P9655]|uniref:holin n=1 Tax=Pseudomonas sp. Marseille-P9655 TaxID=2866591 RepID=UPI001CE3F2FE|nr:holin [Pseudomonas sp. Marseille-P9655]